MNGTAFSFLLDSAASYSPLSMMWACAYATLIAASICFFIRRRIFAQKAESEMHENGLILDLPYLAESVRLSESMLTDLAATIQSYEKKAWLIIASAAAVGVFVIKSDVEVGFFAGSVIVSCFYSVAFSLRALNMSDVGMLGASPNFAVGYYSDIIAEKFLHDADKKDRKKLDNVKQCCLYTVILRGYHARIRISENTANMKLCWLIIARNSIIFGLLNAIAWAILHVAHMG